ncbi:uncharacterized protein LOC141641584 [Silene latifolia]|uniref:uncharacterized protein LOC141641584 n=1 Tax=Silene latifolia TaxID=37657 RepID=UPI003D76D9A1
MISLSALAFPPQTIELLMQCVTTTSYSIALNGVTFGFFQGKRGLRQGDPLSPLLFTICIEYLSRILRVVQRHRQFRHHPLCKHIGLTHLCFADDLIMFCKGDRKSIELLLNAFGYFSKASEIESETGMKPDKVPFKYLGINVSPKRLSVLECHCLVEKVVERIRGLWSRKLAYSGRLVLVESVLSSLHSYWARTFIIPKTVIAKIEAVCRRFLWHALGKYVWWIKQKADHLWVKWVRSIYIKRCTWKEYEPSINSSWAWRKICQVKTIFHQLFYGSVGQLTGQYTIKQGYNFLRPDIEKVRWASLVTVRWMLPRHRLCVWLIAQERLLTQDRLKKMQIIPDNLCFLCGLVEEDHEHLFFRCEYSRKCRDLVHRWCPFQLPAEHCCDWWIKWRSRCLARKKVLAVVLAALMNNIWWCRNKCRVDMILLRPESLVRQIHNEVRLRLNSIRIGSKNSKALHWIDIICKN